MGAGLEAIGEMETKGAGRAARWADERNALILDNGVSKRREQQQVGIASPVETHSRTPFRADSKLSLPATTHVASAPPISTMEVDGPGKIPESNVMGESARVSTTLMADGASSDRRNIPGPAFIGSIPEEQENIQESYSRKHSKSPRKPKSNAHAGPDEAPTFSQSRLRPTTLRTRGQSPRRRVEEDELQDVLAEIIHDQSLTLARAARRQNKGRRSQGSRDCQEPANDDPPSGRVSPRTIHSNSSSLRPGPTDQSQEETLVKMPGRRSKTRRQKRKADVVLDALADDGSIEQSAPGFHPLQGLQQFMSRATRKGITTRVISNIDMEKMKSFRVRDLRRKFEPSSAPSTWMQLFGDVIMWRDIPRSTLLFGAGCFFILSASFIQDVRCGALTFTAYMALLYLGAVFFHRNFLRGSSTQQVGRNWELGESEALEMLRVVLPAINTVLKKCGQLFCGDPSTTLKVASILWVLAQAGYFMTIWSFARFAFVSMFIVPKLYVCYSHQLHGQAEAYANHLWKAWSAYSHKKVAIVGALVLAWNLSSATSRLYGAFLLLVTIRLYNRQLADQTSDQMEVDQSLSSERIK